MASKAQKRKVQKAKKLKGWAARIRTMDESDARREKRHQARNPTFTDVKLNPAHLPETKGRMCKPAKPDEVRLATHRNAVLERRKHHDGVRTWSNPARRLLRHGMLDTGERVWSAGAVLDGGGATVGLLPEGEWRL